MSEGGITLAKLQEAARILEKVKIPSGPYLFVGTREQAAFCFGMSKEHIDLAIADGRLCVIETRLLPVNPD